MPTIPTSPEPVPAATQIHQARQVAESFGAEAERYDRARPRYPDGLIQRIAAASPGPDVLDVGCGTGISSRQLQQAGCGVLGVEPDTQMAQFARQAGVPVEVAKFEDWESGGRRFDAVTAGMAWHWVDPVAGAAKAAQLLRPGGLLALFWYVFLPPEDLRDAFSAVYRRTLPDLPIGQGALPSLEQYSVLFDRAADGIQQANAFAETGRWRYDWDRVYTKQQWLEVVPTFGGHSRLSPDQQARLQAGIGEAVDAAGGSFGAHFTAVAVTTTRNA